MIKILINLIIIFLIFLILRFGFPFLEKMKIKPIKNPRCLGYFMIIIALIKIRIQSNFLNLITFLLLFVYFLNEFYDNYLKNRNNIAINSLSIFILYLLTVIFIESIL